MTINEKIQRIKALNIELCAGDAIIDSGKELIDQQERQFDLGQVADGSSFANDYIPFETFSGRIYHYYALKWTGAFRRGLTITDDFRIESRDKKAPDIYRAISEVSGELYGLTPESVGNTKDLVQDRFIKRVQQDV